VRNLKPKKTIGGAGFVGQSQARHLLNRFKAKIFNVKSIPAELKGLVTVRAVIWFDDGLLSVYENAFPIMKKYGLIGIVAVISSKVGSFQEIENKTFPCMNIQQLKELIENGWEVASHSFTHHQPSINRMEFCDLNLQQTEFEFAKSKEWIIRNLGVTPTKFVVPRHFLRREQMEIGRNYYKFIRSFPLGFPQGHVVYHDIKSQEKFEKSLRSEGIIK
jgi:peptidoglycan/xylan/chitin deacetylase (PgdA/CDA1 family)